MPMTTTYVVSIPDDESMTALNMVPFTWKSRYGDRFIRTIDRHGTIVDGEYTKNFDLGFYPTMDDWQYGLGYTCRDTPVYGRHISFNRHPKDYQSVLFNRMCKEYSNYHPIRSWGVGKVLDKTNQLVVMKNDRGARSMGQVIFDPREVSGVTVRELMRDSKNREAFEKALNQHTGRALYCKGFEHSPEESFKAQKEATFSFMEYIPNITQEWRLITGADGYPFYFLQRDRHSMGTIEGMDFYCASGASQGIARAVDLKDFTHEVGSDNAEQILGMFGRLKAPLQSFDLFITRDHRWGFFETSPEFGTRSVPIFDLVLQAKTFVEDQISLMVKQT